MSKKPIKSSLFRFVTLRSPQAIDDKETKIGLILPSDYTKSNGAFYQAVSAVTEDDDTGRKAAVEGVNITYLKETNADVKAMSTRAAELYDFASWLMRNKDYLTYASIASNLPQTYLDWNTTDPDPAAKLAYDITLQDQEEMEIWDNLLYQTAKRTSDRMRDTFIKMLVANKFAQAFKAFHDAMKEVAGEGEIVFTDKDEEEFTKRANASVVIEKEVLKPTIPIEGTNDQYLPKVNSTILRNEVALKMAESNLRRLKLTQKELKREEALYKAQNTAKYEADLSTHKATVKALQDDPANYTSGSYTGPELPTFSFEPLSIDFTSTTESFSRSSTTEKFLSTDGLSTLKAQEFYGYKDFASMRAALSEEIKNEESKILKAQNNLKPRKVKAGGTEFTISKETANFSMYDFEGCIERTNMLSNVFGVFNFTFTMTVDIFTGLNNTGITSMDTKIVHPNGTEIVATHTETDAAEDSVLLRFTLPDNSFSYTTDKTWSFVATYTFENSDVVEFNAPISLRNNEHFKAYFCFGGRGVVTNIVEPTEPISLPTLNGVTNLGIADYLRVEQEVCCYVPGEVSHIENILAKEYKEKSTRSLVSSEITSEQTRESEAESLTDTTSTERNELSSEVSAVIDEQNSVNFGATASVNFKNFNASSNFGASSSNSTSNSNSQAQNYAQEITERTLERVVKKVSSKRTSRILREFEENNTHGFDNRKGENHITGVYRWVDKVYKNQVVNYGKRLMYEFSIPEPSNFLKLALFEEGDGEDTLSGLIVPTKPVAPHALKVDLEDSEKKLGNASHIEKENYQRLAAEYNAQVEAYPEEALNISAGDSLTGDPTGGHYYSNSKYDISIPDGYQATSVIIDLHVVAADLVEGDTHGALIVSGKQEEIDLPDNDSMLFDSLTNTVLLDHPVHDTLTFALAGSDVYSVSGNVTAICVPTTRTIDQWKNETYNAIIEAYNDRVNEYNDFMRTEVALDEASSDTPAPTFNPGTNRAMERRELKRCAIELLTKGTDMLLARNRYTTNSDNIPVINATEQLKKDVSAIKFFEQAFDWEIMSYSLYPYYYNSPSSWKKLIKDHQEGADPIFQAFLQSGMARVVVPVRQGFETAVNWYEATGEIWEGQGMVTDLNDGLYLSVAEELTDPSGTPVGSPWETKVPTSLTIVQAKSAYLPDGGLPCDPNCSTTSQFGETSLVISGDTGSNAADGVGADIVGTDNNVA